MNKDELIKLLEKVSTPVYQIEADLKMPKTTLQKAIKGERKLPKKWGLKLKEAFLKDSPKEQLKLEDVKNTEIGCYDFGDAPFLVIEKFTKYPIKSKPTDKYQQSVWLKEKTAADNEIKLAWQEHQNKKK